MKSIIDKIISGLGYRLIKNIPRRDYYIVHTNKGVFNLKKINCTISEILFIHNAKKFLINRGFTNIAEYITWEGNPYKEYDKEYYVMTRWIKGRRYDISNCEEIKNASKTLARLHNASKGYDLTLKNEIRSNMEKLQEDYLERCEDFIYMKSLVKMKSIKDGIDILFLNEVDMLYDKGIESVKMLQRNGYFEACKEKAMEKYLCHSNYNHNNIIIGGDGEVNVINFDSCKFDLTCFDIAGFIMDAMDRLNWNFEVALEILEEYDKVRNIEEREYRLIGSFLQFPKDIWKITTRYYYEDYKYFKHKYYIELKDRIEKIPYWVDFLEKYKGRFS